MEAIEYATLEWVDWFNHRRLLEPIGNVPPAELGMQYFRQRSEQAVLAGLNANSLRRIRGDSLLSLRARRLGRDCRFAPRRQNLITRRGGLRSSIRHRSCVSL